MKFLLSVLALAVTSNAAFTCDPVCAKGFYTFMKGSNLKAHGLKDVDAAVYAYMVYENFSQTGEKGTPNIDLLTAFVKQVGKTCKITDATWQRDDIVKCFEDFSCDDVDATKEAFKPCNADNADGCDRMFGLFLDQFSGPSCFTDVWKSELSADDKIRGVKVYKVFMGVMENWEAMGETCQNKVKESAGYKEGDDVVLKFADKADEIITGLKSEACGYTGDAFGTDAAGAAAKAASTAVTEAKAEVAKLETKIKAEAGSAYTLSFAAAAVAALLL